MRKAVLIICIVSVFIMYGQSLAGDFVYDDRNLVAYSSKLANLEDLDEVAMHPFWSEEAGLYRPATLLSYSLNFFLLGSQPAGFHLINILLYAAIGFLIYLFVKRILPSITAAHPLLQEITAALTALIFLVLPIHSEVVANISGRGELLALLFSLLALLEFSKEKVSWRAGLWVMLALGSKETAIALIPLVLLILYFLEKKISVEIFKRRFLSLSYLLIGTLAYFFLRFFALGPSHFIGNVQTTMIENPLIFTDAFSRAMTALKVLAMYVGKTFWPANLCSDYSFDQIPIVHTLANGQALLGAFILAVGLTAIFIFIRKNPVISLGSAIFFFSFSPVSNVVFPTGTIAGERLFFFPSLGFCLIASYYLSKLILSPRKSVKIVSGILIAGIIITYAAITTNRQSVWLDEESLFLSAAKCAPRSVLSRSNAGAIYLLKDDLAKAKEELEIARDIKPIYSKGLNNLGLVYWKLGESDRALEMYHEALKQDFPYPGTYFNLYLLYKQKGDEKSAERWLRLAEDAVQ